MGSKVALILLDLWAHGVAPFPYLDESKILQVTEIKQNIFMFPLVKGEEKENGPPRGQGVPLSDPPVSPSKIGIESLISIVRAWKVMIRKSSFQVCERQEMFLALTPTDGVDAARTAGQETGATSRETGATSRLP
jgi:hypothetical protein